VVFDFIGRPLVRPEKATPPDQRKYTKVKLDKAGTVLEPSRLYANQREADETQGEYAERVADLQKEYGRVEVTITDEMVTNLLRRAERTLARIEAMAQGAAEPQQNPAGCNAYHTDCDYLAACSGLVKVDDVTRFIRRDNGRQTAIAA